MALGKAGKLYEPLWSLIKTGKYEHFRRKDTRKTRNNRIYEKLEKYGI